MQVSANNRIRFDRPVSFLRLKAVRSACGEVGESTIYRWVEDGTFPPPIKLGERCSAWASHEVSAVNASKLSGISREELRALVVNLVKARRAAPVAEPEAA